MAVHDQVGGVDKKYNKLASVESFDPESGVWSEEPPMLTARCFPAPKAYNYPTQILHGPAYIPRRARKPLT